MRVIWIVQKETAVIQRLIQVNARQYWGVDEKDIKALDQTYAKIDRTVEYTRRIIIKLPYIIERMLRVDMMKKYRNGLKVRKKNFHGSIFTKHILMLLDCRHNNSKKFGDNTRRIQSQDFGGDKYSKNFSDNTIRIQP